MNTQINEREATILKDISQLSQGGIMFVGAPGSGKSELDKFYIFEKLTDCDFNHGK